MNGITIIIILLVPILIQAVYQGYTAERRHKEITKRLERIESELSGK